MRGESDLLAVQRDSGLLSHRGKLIESRCYLTLACLHLRVTSSQLQLWGFHKGLAFLDLILSRFAHLVPLAEVPRNANEDQKEDDEVEPV
jgi:hypothetical protein